MKTLKRGIHLESLARLRYFPATVPDLEEKPGHFREWQRLFTECLYLQASFQDGRKIGARKQM